MYIYIYDELLVAAAGPATSLKYLILKDGTLRSPNLSSFQPICYSPPLLVPQQHPFVHYAYGSSGRLRRHVRRLLSHCSHRGRATSVHYEHCRSESPGIRVAHFARLVESVPRTCRRPSLQLLSFISPRRAYYQRWYVRRIFRFCPFFIPSSHKGTAPPISGPANTAGRARNHGKTSARIFNVGCRFLFCPLSLTFA